MFVSTLTIKNNIMTTAELYTTLQNDLVDEQRAMDRMDADRDYDINYVNQKVKQYTKK